MPAPIRIELPTEFPVGPVNVYLFTEPEPVLIDTGVKFKPSWEALQAGLMDHGVRVGDLSKVIITHPHVDHFGQAGRIAANSDAEIWVSTLGEEWSLHMADSWQKRIDYYRDTFLPKLDMPAKMQEPMLRFMRLSRNAAEDIPADRLHTFAPDARLTFGGMEWDSIHAPGHDSHQTCFYQPDTRQFLAADMLLEHTPTPVIERPFSGDLTARHDPSLPRFLESLMVVDALDISTVYPGHGEPFTDYHALITRQQHRIGRRKAKTLTLIKRGCNTVNGLLDKMYAHYPDAYRLVGLWMQIGYIDLLLADGAIREEVVDGIWRYTAT